MSQTPEQAIQQGAPRRGPFLARCARWQWHDSERIDILDDRGQATLTLDTWQTLVFHQADGNHSLEMIIAWFPSQYRDPGRVPPDYRGAISNAAGYLIGERRWVAELERPGDLAPEVALPHSEQTIDPA